jgi:tight adherence protein B
LEIQIFVVALMIHRQTGGNLSQLLQKLSLVIRERERMNSKIQSLTAEGQMQAYVLAGLPFVVGGMIAVANPAYMVPLLENPIVFVIAGILLITGFLWMQKIIRFDY